VFGALAFGDMLASAAAGMYLLLEEPYGIGDEVQIGDRRGIVQETQILVTYVESDDEVHVVPNRLVFRDGIVRYRD
jgi:small-conductance mechanosensitive channel